jgi:hypothetical protein
MSNPRIKRQYEIEVAPFTTTPIATAGMSDVQTNLSYLQVRWMAGALPVSLLFSKHRFSTQNYQSPEGAKGVWLLNLAPMYMAAYNPGQGPATLPDISLFNPVLRTGSLTHLEWGKEYVLQPQGVDDRVMIRAVDLDPGMIDEVPTMHNWGGDVNKWLPDESNQAAMPSLLSRLGALSAS